MGASDSCGRQTAKAKQEITNTAHTRSYDFKALKNRDGGLRRPGCHTIFTLRRLLLCDALLPELSAA